MSLIAKAVIAHILSVRPQPGYAKHHSKCTCGTHVTAEICRRRQPALVLRSLGDAGCLGDLGDPTLAGAGPLVDFSTGLKFGLEQVLGPCSSSSALSVPSAGADGSADLVDAGISADVGDCAKPLGDLGLSAWSCPAKVAAKSEEESYHLTDMQTYVWQKQHWLLNFVILWLQYSFCPLCSCCSYHQEQDSSCH